MDHYIYVPGDPIQHPSETEFKTSVPNEEGCAKTKYRNIPVGKTLDGLKVSAIKCENVSGIKELKKQYGSVFKGSTNPTGNKSVLNTKNLMRNKQRSRLESKISLNTVHRKQYSNHSFLDRIGQGSRSEPTLTIAKDRGDSINVQDIYREDKVGSNAHFGDERSQPQKKTGIKGCIYVRNSGKIYKSSIDAKGVTPQEDNEFYKFLGTKSRRSEKMSLPFGNSNLKNRFRDSTGYGSSGLKLANEGCGDFEIAIFLSGIKDLSGSNLPKQKVSDDTMKKGYRFRMEKKNQKKKRVPRKKQKSVPLPGKSLESANKDDPSMMVDADDGKDTSSKQGSERSKISLYGRMRPLNKTYRASDLRLDISSASESEYVFEIPQRVPKNKRSVKKFPINGCKTGRDSIKPNGNEIQDGSGCFRFRRNDNASYRSRVISESSICEFSDDYEIPKLKMSDEELFGKFEFIFRRYATTLRHVGEVIPRKISTQWMTHVGVVDEILTEKEADDAFRQAAGAKITMNAQEYKEFLITLTLKMKLSYYEIYRRMCGM